MKKRINMLLKSIQWNDNFYRIHGYAVYSHKNYNSLSFNVSYMLHIYTIIIFQQQKYIVQKQPLKDVLENKCCQNFKKTIASSL